MTKTRPCIFVMSQICPRANAEFIRGADMNGFRPTVGIEFDDKYKNAKAKLTDFVESLKDLTPSQREQLAREYINTVGMPVILSQFIGFTNFMSNGGQF